MKKQDLAKLLNDYHNSEFELYFKLKEELNSGINLNFTNLSLGSQKIEEALDIFYIIHEVSERFVDVGYNYSELDHNIKILLFDDDIVDFKLFENNKLIGTFNDISLKPFSSYLINRMPNIFKDRKKTSNYQIFLKLKKQGEERSLYEKNTIEDPSIFSKKIKTDISTILKSYISKNLEEDYPQKIPWMRERLKLWGYETSHLSAQDISGLISSLGDADFGVKDIVQLTYIPDLFVNEKCKNEKIIKELDKILGLRRETWKKTIAMISTK